VQEQQHSPDYRTVAAFGNVAEAELARGLLESDGIPAALLDGIDAALLPGAGRSVRVLVPAVDLDRARDLLGPAELRTDPAEDLVPPAPAGERSWTSPWILALVLGAAAAALGVALAYPR
jgi:hypothetical protein